MSAPDRANRPVWADLDTVTSLDAQGFTDAGERLALLHLAPEWRGQPILDIGFGTGRTTTLLRLITDDYRGIDYTPEMVSAARAQHPGADLSSGDARDLSAFADGSMAGVIFSFNGLDALSRDDRMQALNEMRRVLRPGGSVLFSTLNKNGPDWAVRPWRSPDLPWIIGSLQPYGGALPLRLARRAARTAMRPAAPARRMLNWQRARRSVRDEGGWGYAVLAAHDFRLVAHFITLDQQLVDLAECGLAAECVLAAEDGRVLKEGEPTNGVRWFQIVARAADDHGPSADEPGD